MSIPYYIEKILKENKITDFLSERGIHPVKESSNKLIYHCPIHTDDKDPSFMIYINQEYQTYFCYSCKSGTNIINLLSDIDNISIRYAIFCLSKNIDISDEEVINSIIEDMENSEMKKSEKDDEISNLFLKINKICYYYLEDAKFDKEEIGFLNSFFEKIDNTVAERDLELLRETCDSLIEKDLPLRAKQYTERKEKEGVV